MIELTSHQTYIEKNEISNCFRSGIHINDGCMGSWVLENTVFSNTDDGIYCDGFRTNISLNIVYDNEIGIKILNAENRVFSNLCYNNTEYGIKTTGSDSGYGLYVFNILTNNTLGGIYIVFSSASNIIVGNYISGSQTGINLISLVDRNTLADNKIATCNYGIMINNSDFTLIIGNLFEDVDVCIIEDLYCDGAMIMNNLCNPLPDDGNSDDRVDSDEYIVWVWGLSIFGGVELFALSALLIKKLKS